MCGIVGCVAERPVAGILLDGLKRVEYRGYDSAGMATTNGRRLEIRKGVGRIAELAEKKDFSGMLGNIGMAHCLHPDTHVQLADGRIKRIADMEDEEEVASLDTQTLKIVSRRAVRSSHPAPLYLLKISTDSTEVVCTDTHKMIVARNGDLVQTPASQLLEGDLLILPKALAIKGRSRKLDEVNSKRFVRPSREWTEAVKCLVEQRHVNVAEAARRCGVSSSYLGHVVRGDRSLREDVAKRVEDVFKLRVAGGLVPVSHSHSNYVRFPSMTSPALLEVVGYLFGAGHVHPKGVRVREEDLGLLQHYQRLFLRIFGLEGRIMKVGRADTYELTVNSVALSRWLHLNFDFGSAAFLTRLGRLPNDEVAAFIRGVFDAEGFVDTLSRQIAMRITAEPASRMLQALLVRFGVHSSVFVTKEKNPRRSPCRILSISGHEDISGFIRQISSSSSPKLREMFTLEGETKSRRSAGEMSVSHPKREPRDIAAGGENLYLERGEYPTLGTVNRLVEHPQTRSEDRPLESVLHRFTDSQVYFEKITSVVPVASDTTQVYDLEVEGTENFLANGIFTHNSRWATHGGVTDKNAHPHASCRERVVVVHNGIIENYVSLKKGLIANGHRFRSETDTEVVAHLIEDEYERTRDPLKATSAGVKKLKGQYAVAVMFQDRPDVMTGARKDAPLIVGVGERMMFLASDVLAFIGHTDRTIFLDNYEVVEITKDGVKIVGRDGKRVRREPDQVAWELSDVTKSDYAHYTLKEINEQPRTVVSASLQDAEKLERFARAIRRTKSLYITASGTSYHAGLLMKFRLNKEAKVRADVVVAGELKEHAEFLGKGSVLIAISQSGETADVMEAVKEAKRHGTSVYSIVNAAGSSLARESDEVLLLNCGPEVGVAATKSFTAQVVVVNLVVDAVLGKKRPGSAEELSRAVAEALKCDGPIQELVRAYADRPDFYFVARGYESPVALEGALKLKELSYIHAEGMPASELKHGTLALIEKGTPVVVINPSGPNHAESLSSAEELRARGADIIGISDVEDEVYKHFVRVPKVQPKFTPVVEAIPLQLLAYRMSVARSNDPDYPRNLAKSVTVK
ncbi:MAG: glutamine--fructose-6-phosphate transaminase (isomerizing) [Nitrososphaerota archaeon]|jgi:glucosamine--fructose-6-phosphate aminotransferase (isomerizing)|nr:glutamine--fructose-6-phosphate transaminase (isomerizing) [Nitrososphaerota archaeon]MDG6942137.1 glutamine--fructose-6-phosphate transaminase (isomerizing) [Nitrososphaerota archaeon]MDG6942602.1 glutamine--fructose-6-phosphate transaminase (isomerizing) [Nitrososphaerota archaeon]MDG6948389.1 glutamine--fructose-6-phosphate transaminase (isomerizing) [Nitrososphaerota archaeon]MDG6950315.1 glutamine--fructose-6-phosphate transaminase (isomerizing) [Nitrososphaerota archaeon]